MVNYHVFNCWCIQSIFLKFFEDTCVNTVYISFLQQCQFWDTSALSWSNMTCSSTNGNVKEIDGKVYVPCSCTELGMVSATGQPIPTSNDGSKNNSGESPPTGSSPSKIAKGSRFLYNYYKSSFACTSIFIGFMSPGSTLAILYSSNWVR